MDIGKSIKDSISEFIKLSVYNSVRKEVWPVVIKWVSVRILVKDSVRTSITSVYGNR